MPLNSVLCQPLSTQPIKDRPKTIRYDVECGFGSSGTLEIRRKKNGSVSATLLRRFLGIQTSETEISIHDFSEICWGTTSEMLLAKRATSSSPSGILAIVISCIAMILTGVLVGLLLVFGFVVMISTGSALLFFAMIYFFIGPMFDRSESRQASVSQLQDNLKNQAIAELYASGAMATGSQMEADATYLVELRGKKIDPICIYSGSSRPHARSVAEELANICNLPINHLSSLG